MSCRFHLLADVGRSGGLKLNFGTDDVDEPEHTCALDVAEQGGMTLERLGQIMGLTRERVRQIEAEAVSKLRRGAAEADPEDDLQASSRVALVGGG